MTGAGDREVCFLIKRKHFEFPSSAKLARLSPGSLRPRGLYQHGTGCVSLLWAAAEAAASSEADRPEQPHQRAFSRKRQGTARLGATGCASLPATGPLRGGWSSRVK